MCQAEPEAHLMSIISSEGRGHPVGKGSLYSMEAILMGNIREVQTRCTMEAYLSCDSRRRDEARTPQRRT